MDERERSQELYQRIQELEAKKKDLPNLEKHEIETCSELREVGLSCFIAERVLRTSDPLLRSFQLQLEERRNGFLAWRKNLQSELDLAKQHLEAITSPIIIVIIERWRGDVGKLPKIERSGGDRGFDSRRGVPLVRVLSNENSIRSARETILKAIDKLGKMTHRPISEINEFVEKTQGTIEGLSDFSPKEELMDEIDLARTQFLEKGLG
jgi:hypothetical protein